MDRGEGSLDRDLLVEQSPWVHAFARRIVRDPHGANDIAQEALLAALLSPPPRRESARDLRAWLGGVTVNLARRSLQLGSRRAAREKSAARTEALPSILDALGRDAVHELVAQAVASLEEPYRSAIRQRYFESVPIADIARRCATSEARVRKWLWRGRRLLRARLARTTRERGPHGGAAWLSALIGLRLTEVKACLRWLAGTHSVRVGTLALLVCVGLDLFWRSSDRRLPSGDELARASDAAEPGGSLSMGGPGGRRPASSQRIAGETGVPEPKRELPAGLQHGSVVDLHGRALRDARVVDGRGDLLGSTDPAGRFAVAPTSYPARLSVDRSDLSLVRAARVRSAPDGAESWIVAAPAIDVSGWVFDPQGLPLEDATVSLVYGPDAFLELPFLLPLAEAELHSTRTIARGGFGLARIPSGRGLWLEARHPAWGAVRSPVPPLSSAGITLSFAERGTLTLAGAVVDELGVPLAGARVGTPEVSTWTNARGRFELELPRASGATLVASKPTFHAAHVDLDELEAGTASGGPQHLRLALGGRSGSLRGAVLAEDGSPLRSGLVFACTNAQAGTGRAPIADPRPGAALPDETGTFELEGLSAAEYTIVAFEPDSKVFAAVQVTPGSGSRLEIRARPALGMARDIRLLDSQGRALAQASVEARLHLNTEAGPWTAVLGEARADSSGSFRFPEVPDGFVMLHVAHPTLALEEILPLPARGDAALQVDPQAIVSLWGRSAGTVRFLDEAGVLVPVLTPAGPASEVRLLGGLTGCIGVGPRARTLELREPSGASRQLRLEIAGSTAPWRIDLP